MAAGALGRAGVVARLVDQRPRRAAPGTLRCLRLRGSFLPHTCYSHTTQGNTKILCIRNGPVSPLISAHRYTKSLPTSLSLGWAHSPTFMGCGHGQGGLLSRGLTCGFVPLLLLFPGVPALCISFCVLLPGRDYSEQGGTTSVPPVLKIVLLQVSNWGCLVSAAQGRVYGGDYQRYSMASQLLLSPWHMGQKDRNVGVLHGLLGLRPCAFLSCPSSVSLQREVGIWGSGQLEAPYHWVCFPHPQLLRKSRPEEPKCPPSVPPHQHGLGPHTCLCLTSRQPFWVWPGSPHSTCTHPWTCRREVVGWLGGWDWAGLGILFKARCLTIPPSPPAQPWAPGPWLATGAWDKAHRTEPH